MMKVSVLAVVLMMVIMAALVEMSPAADERAWRTTTTTRSPGSTTTTRSPFTSTRAPSTAAPSTSAPSTSAPSTSAPSTAAPSTSAPSTSAPSTSAPSTSAPSTSAPSTSAPSTPAPTTTRAATTTAPVTSTSSGSTFSTDITTQHNNARAPVRDKTLSWNDTIATFAANYAKGCNFAHNSNRNGYGENIYAGSGQIPSDIGVRASTSWINEKADFACPTNTCASGKTCGHYTQVIWGNTNEVGCGAVYCTTNSPFGASFPNWHFVVCDYNPPGNYVGQFPVPAANCV